MNQPIKAAMLAYGMSGKIFHAPFLAAHPGFELTAVLERTHKNAKKDYPEIKTYNSLSDLLADPNIELVVVNTPNFLHYEQAKEALNASKHVLVEKPITARPEQLEELYKIADEKGKQLFFYQNRRWDSDYQTIVKVAQSGDLGHIHEAHFRFDRYNLSLSPKTFKESAVEASGIQYDLIPHVLDQAIALFGRPDKFYKRLLKLRPKSQVDDYCSIQLSYNSGLEVYVVASLLTVNPGPAYNLYGSNGSYEKYRSDMQEDHLKEGLKPKDEYFGHPDGLYGGGMLILNQDGELKTNIQSEPDSNYLGLFEAVYQTLRNGVHYPITREQILTQIQILAAPAS